MQEVLELKKRKEKKKEAKNTDAGTLSSASKPTCKYLTHIYIYINIKEIIKNKKNALSDRNHNRKSNNSQ